MGRVWRVTEKLEFGIVGVNEGIVATELAPFGGVKESGLGREGSRHGVEEFLEMKYMYFGRAFGLTGNSQSYKRQAAEYALELVEKTGHGSGSRNGLHGR